MDTKAFNEQNFDKSRAVCEGIEREDCCSDYKTETNKLRNQLNASERKSERRLRQIDHLESVIRNRNAELKKRKQLVHELRNEVRRLGKQVSDLSAEREDGDGRAVLTDREREILDMWPRFEEEVPMNNFMGEIWKPVAGFDGKYEVSNCGRVRSIDHEVQSLGGWRTVKGRVLKQRVEHGYCRVQLSIDKSSHPHKQVHRLVAEAFVPNPENKPEVNHIDGCKTNNCSDNLEWVTSSENSIHALENGLQSHKSDEEMQKMWEASSKPVIRDDGEWYASASKAAESIGAERSSVAKAIRRGSSIYGHTFRYADKLKRPAPKVLDADGVEIKVGDTVYAPRMYGDTSFTVSRFTKNCDGDTLVMVEEMGSGLFPSCLTHTRPDSWERLEMDAELNDETGIVGGNLDIVRRAKALAGAGE